MAYAQWVTMTLKPIGFDLTVKNVKLDWGKFYAKDNKDIEIDKSGIEGMVINSGLSAIISACGRSDAASGTEGQFDLYDNGRQIGTYYWDCPWGTKTNKSKWTPVVEDDDAYITQITGANLNSGALGNIIIKSVKTN
ncbi:MAG: aegerolysin [Alphaproteobacteria bacterium]|nr:MAG: aegerolysin [Alphaproteobacteria bacterium]